MKISDKIDIETLIQIIKTICIFVKYSLLEAM